MQTGLRLGLPRALVEAQLQPSFSTYFKRATRKHGGGPRAAPLAPRLCGRSRGTRSALSPTPPRGGHRWKGGLGGSDPNTTTAVLRLRPPLQACGSPAKVAQKRSPDREETRGRSPGERVPPPLPRLCPPGTGAARSPRARGSPWEAPPPRTLQRYYARITRPRLLPQQPRARAGRPERSPNTRGEPTHAVSTPPPRSFPRRLPSMSPRVSSSPSSVRVSMPSVASSPPSMAQARCLPSAL